MRRVDFVVTDLAPDDRTTGVAAADTYNAGITWLVDPLQGVADGPLAGRTLLVKDLIDTAGIRTTYGSKIYADHVPARHATVVQRALDAGAVVVGKGNLPEFAWGVLGANPWYGTVHNPLHPGKTTGGSSAGNAAAIAAGLVDLGIGTDTGCSIRLPSAACGTVGLKSGWGLLPLDGVFPLCPSFDTVGPMGRTVELMSRCSGRPCPEHSARSHGSTASRWDCCDERPISETGARRRRATLPRHGSASLSDLGARVVESAIPAAQADLWPLFLHEAAWSHRRTFPSRADEYAHTIRRSSRRRSSFGRRRRRAREALAAWRVVRAEVDLYVCPCYAVDLPAEDADELDVRLPLPSFLRWVNLIGWAGLAVGEHAVRRPRRLDGSRRRSGVGASVESTAVRRA